MHLPRRNFFKRLAWIFGAAQLPKIDPTEIASAADADAKAKKGFSQHTIPTYENIKAEFDLVVVGGGISGTTTAISAAGATRAASTPTL